MSHALKEACLMAEGPPDCSGSETVMSPRSTGGPWQSTPPPLVQRSTERERGPQSERFETNRRF